MNVYVDGVYMGWSVGTYSWYLIVLDVTINTFIPDDNYAIGPLTGTGDDREWNRWGSSRTWQLEAVLQPNTTSNLLLEDVHDTGVSMLYDLSLWAAPFCWPGAPSSVDENGRLTQEAKDDWNQGCPLKINWGQPSGATLACSTQKESRTRMYLNCYGNEATPVMQYAPGITYDLSVSFFFYDEGAVDYLVQGAHDGFPNYEIYVGDQLIYSHDYRAYGQGISSLGPPMEFAGINASGRVW